MLKRIRLEVDNYNKQDRRYTINLCVVDIMGMRGKVTNYASGSRPIH